MFRLLKRLFYKPTTVINNNDPLFSAFDAIENYRRKSWQEIGEFLNTPRRKSDFEIQAERKLGLHLPEYY